MTTKQRFFWLALLLELIFLLQYAWVTVTSHFPMQLVTLVSFLTAGLHWRNRWTNSVNWHTWRSGGSVQCDSIFLLKPPKLSFPQVILDKIQRVISARLIFKVPRSARVTPFLYDLHWLPISRWIQNKIDLICFHIVSDTALLYLSELLHLYSPSRSLRSAADTRIFRAPTMGRKALGEGGGGGEIFSLHRTCALELPSFLCQAFVFTLFF